MERPDISSGPGAPALQVEQSGDLLLVRLEGRWIIGRNLPALTPLSRALQSTPRPRRIAFDAAGLDGWDSRFLLFCRNVASMAAGAGVEMDTSGLPEGAMRLLTLAAKVPPRPGAARAKESTSFLALVGTRALGIWENCRELLAFIGETTLAVGQLLRGRAVFRACDLWSLLKQCGLDALPIVSLISLLVGLILAFIGAIQLQMFGAEIYVSGLVGIAMTRVMGAIMTGIIMAGRTGASFAAEIGTMQVNEEIDALRTLGIGPMEFLVLPRMLALVMMLPLLCLYADLMGILGGFLVGVMMLEISPEAYLQATWESVGLVNIWIGLIHSATFGVLVALSGCYQGMRCGRSASAVGLATTSSVVASIVSIIVATAIITLMCNFFGV